MNAFVYLAVVACPPFSRLRNVEQCVDDSVAGRQYRAYYIAPIRYPPDVFVVCNEHFLPFSGFIALHFSPKWERDTTVPGRAHRGQFLP